MTREVRKGLFEPVVYRAFLRFSEKYLEFPNNIAIFVPKNNKDENNIQKYIG